MAMIATTGLVLPCAGITFIPKVLDLRESAGLIREVELVNMAYYSEVRKKKPLTVINRVVEDRFKPVGVGRVDLRVPPYTMGLKAGVEVRMEGIKRRVLNFEGRENFPFLVKAALMLKLPLAEGPSQLRLHSDIDKGAVDLSEIEHYRDHHLKMNGDESLVIYNLGNKALFGVRSKREGTGSQVEVPSNTAIVISEDACKRYDIWMSTKKFEKKCFSKSPLETILRVAYVFGK